jgi:hypothetical protein
MSQWTDLLQSVERAEPSPLVPARALARAVELGDQPAQRRARKAITLVAVAAAAFLVLAALVIAAHSRSSAPAPANHAPPPAMPKQLTGRWGRGNKTVLMIVSPGGKVDFDAQWNAEFSHVTAHRLSISGLPTCSGTGVYRWWIVNHPGASDQLTLKKIHDPCSVRVGAFAGVWLTAYPMR